MKIMVLLSWNPPLFFLLSHCFIIITRVGLSEGGERYFWEEIFNRGNDLLRDKESFFLIMVAISVMSRFST